MDAIETPINYAPRHCYRPTLSDALATLALALIMPVALNYLFAMARDFAA
jgi:hypothetical protein